MVHIGRKLYGFLGPQHWKQTPCRARSSVSAGSSLLVSPAWLAKLSVVCMRAAPQTWRRAQSSTSTYESPSAQSIVVRSKVLVAIVFGGPTGVLIARIHVPRIDTRS